VEAAAAVNRHCLGVLSKSNEKNSFSLAQKNTTVIRSMNTIVETVIARVLSPYLEGVSRDNLSLGLMSGSLSLSNLKVKSSVLTELHLHQASFERASVDSVLITYPLVNLLTGNITIDVSGVDLLVRLYETETLDRDKLVAIKRDFIESIKEDLARVEPPTLAGMHPDSLTAKILRRVIDALVVRVDDITIGVLMPKSSSAEVDEEGFQDANEELSGLETLVGVHLHRVSVEDLPVDREIEGMKLMKRFSLTGLSVTQSEDVIVPNLSLQVDVQHDMVSQTLETTVTGLDDCLVSISDLHVSTLTEVFIKGSAKSSVSPVEMGPDARASYLSLYRQFMSMESELWTDSRHKTKQGLDQMALLFEPNTIAQLELMVDRQRVVAQTEKEWKSWFTGPSIDETAWADIEAGSEVQAPSFIKIKLEIGNAWHIILREESATQNVLDIKLNGALFDVDVTNQFGGLTASGYAGFKGLSLQHRDRDVLQLGHEERGPETLPLEVWVDYAETKLKLKAISQPLKLQYQPGLVRDVQQFFQPLSELDFSEQQRALIRSYKRLQTSQEIVQFTSSMMPKSWEVDLDMACPVIVVPCSAKGSEGDRLVVSLGHLSAKGDQGLLDQVSFSFESGEGSSMQVLSPSPVDISLLYEQSSQMVHLDLSMADRTVCRVSPETVRSASALAEFMQSELPQPAGEANTIEQGEELSLAESGSIGPQPGFLINCEIRKIDLMVSDGSSDLLNVLVSVPSLSFGYSMETKDIALSVDSLGIVSRCVNTTVGDWEPLIEPATVSLSGHAAGADASFSLSSAGINVSANPNTVAVLRRLADLFTRSAEGKPVPTNQFRVVNAARRKIFVGVPESKCSLIELLPSGDFYSLDTLVMSSGAREILLSFQDDRNSAIQLPLDGVYASRFEDCIVHAMIPDRSAQFRTILISSDGFVINQCDIPLELSLPASFPTPSADLLGAVVFRGSTVSLNPLEDSLILNPGKFVSLSQVELLELQVRPLTGGRRSWTPVTGSGIDMDCGGGFHLRAENELKPDPVSIRHVHLRPPLVAVNNLPVPIKVKHSTAGRNVYITVPEWDCVAIYSSESSLDAKNFNASVAFIGESSEWSKPLGAGPLPEERHLISPMIGSVHPVHLTTMIRHAREITVSAKWWLVDRTGLNNLMVLHADTGIPLPKGADNVWLLPDPDIATTVEFAWGRYRWEQPLLDGGFVSGNLGPTTLVMNSRETLDDKFIEIVPRFTFFNAIDGEGILISSKFTGGGTWNAYDLVEPQSGIPLLHAQYASFKFQFPDGSTSCEIPLRESSAGIWPLLVGYDRVCKLEISPVDGCVHVTVRAGSTIRATNKKRKKSVMIDGDYGRVFTVEPGTSQEIGWTDPFFNATVSTILRVEGSAEPITVPLARASETVRYGGCVRVVAGEAPQSIQIIVDSDEAQETSTIRVISVDVEIGKFGFSLTRGGKELLFMELALIRALLKQSQDAVRIAALVSEVQIETSVSRNNARPVIVANLGEGSRPFVEILIVLSTTVSRGVVAVPKMQVQFDSLFVEVDSKLASAMDEFLNEIVGLDLDDDPRSGMASTQHAKRLLTKELLPIVRGRVEPVPAPDILILDSLFFSKLGIELWVNFALKSMVFMPTSLKLIVGVLSMGSAFKLEGAHVLIRPRAVDSFKGSADQFFQSLQRDYAVEALRNTASLLGNSSLLAIPRAPITFVSGVGSKGIEKAAGAVSNVVELLSDLTADASYREQQQRIRRSKKIAGFADGCIESANRIGEGLEGVLDIFKKPVEGAKRGGMSGFVRGIGTGLIGTVVKPIAKVGEALGDMGTGIARSFKPASRKDEDRIVHVRRRIARAFYGTNKAVEDYRALDAMLYAALPLEGMEITVMLRHGKVMVGFIDRIAVVEVKTERQLSTASVGVHTPGAHVETPTQEEPTAETRPASSTIEDMPMMDVSLVILDEISAAEIASIACIEKVGSVLIDTERGSRIELELERSELAAAVARTMESKHSWDWREVKHMIEEIDFSELSQRRPEATPEQGATLVEVWEVERFLMAYGWVTPFMMLDVNTGWRWVDENMHKHQRIDGRLSRKECAETKKPPLVFGELLKPTDDWRIEIDPETTDEHGWRYAISFSSSTWENAPGIAASVRKRKWTRPIA